MSSRCTQAQWLMITHAEGAMIRIKGSGLLLFSHAGDINGTGGRFNMTIWASNDSAATWRPILQVEPDADIALHQAYSTMLQLSPNEILIVWERGPMGGSCKGYPDTQHCFQPAGEYQTLRARVVTLHTYHLQNVSNTTGILDGLTENPLRFEISVCLMMFRSR
eukprot:COSAG01_NODE_3892_length_5578_cov_5.863296_5_plen_164_part_00